MIRIPAFRTSAAIFVLAAFVVSGAAITTPTPAAARIDVSIGFNAGGIGFGYFHRNLGYRGRWIDHPRWGDAWQPPHACSYRPFFNGHFVYTNRGLLWVGFDRWSNVTDHYGRWVKDRRYCMLWIPGYVWSPAWVIWRTGGGYFGWMPMPPDYGDFDDGPYFGESYGWDDWYGYRDWYGDDDNAFYGLWIFVDDNHFYRDDYRRYAVDRRRVPDLFRVTRDSTHYAVENDQIVNRSISPERLQRVTHERIQPRPVNEFLKANVPMARVSQGRELGQHEGSGNPGPRRHDSNFRLLKGPRSDVNAPGGERGRMDRGRMNGPEATPSLQPQPNAEEFRGRGNKRGGVNEATPSSQPQPNGGEERRRNRGGEETMQPSPQPESQPALGGEKHLRGRNRGSEETMQPSPQPESQPAPGTEDRGRGRRGGVNEATPSPQPQPSGEGARGPKRGPGNTEGKSQDAGTGATGQGTQGRERPNAGKKKKDTEQPANPDEDKDKKKPNSDENGPGN